MKKNILIKGILLLIVIALLTMGLSGCGVIATTGTVYIVVYGWDFYNLYMDYAPQSWGVTAGTYVFYNVPIGSHFFEAEDTWGWLWGYDSWTQYITAGVNYVYLYPY